MSQKGEHRLVENVLPANLLKNFRFIILEDQWDIGEIMELDLMGRIVTLIIQSKLISQNVNKFYLKITTLNITVLQKVDFESCFQANQT